MSHTYDTQFMDYAAVSSAHAAQRVTSLLRQNLEINSVLDVGCAHGTWLRTWSEAGARDVHGLDGDYVDTAKLEIPAGAFTAANLNRPFDLERRFDLVQSLEVGEHIRTQASQHFVDSIAQHATKYVLYSAAPPGQGGEFHINEQSFEFWRGHFARHGFAVFDWLRPQIVSDSRISFWYRYNMFLYVRREHVAALSAAIRETEIPAGVALRDLSPLGFRVRKAMIRRLPYRVQHEVARLKARVMPTGRF
jgi:SAM-dependent methyltransferase